MAHNFSNTVNRALALALVLSTVSHAESAVTNNPARLKRADSFLGMHFDFHAGPDCQEVGRNTTPAMIENIIKLVRPDYLQIDCKGHPGYSSYPTKVGNPVPGFSGGDPLRVWRDVTARHGVALFMHYSGVWDSKAVKDHPDWAAVMVSGTNSPNAISLFGPYQDQLLIPQLRELGGVYGVDGMWVDGECWAAVPDYSPAALETFRAATGIAIAPRKPGEPHWFEFLQFHREAFRRYLRDYLARVNQTHPDLQLCSNWAFTDHMPEPVTAPVAFLSGDFDPNDSVNSARLSARFTAQQGKPWDLMAWSFSTKPAQIQKPAVQLQREAAIVLAQGGGFQAYFKQKRDGSIYDEQMPVMAEVAVFCRARQKLAHHSQAIPQIAVVLSQEDQYRRNNGLFNRNLTRVKGALQALVESQYSVQVLGEHNLAGHCAEYPVIVVPECDHLPPGFRNQLAGYVRQGGNLLLVGPGSARLFERELGVTLVGDLRAATPLQLAGKNFRGEIQAQCQNVVLGPQARSFGELRLGINSEAPSQPAASISKYGRGRIAAVYFTAGQVYFKDRSAVLRHFLKEITQELFPQPLVEVTGAEEVEVTAARNQGQLLVHLVNSSGPHQTQSIIENIPSIGPLTVTIRLNKKPVSVTLEPGARPLAFEYRPGRLQLTVPKVEIYDIIAIHSK